MNLAVMQPYLFPYIGYFQLIHASDLFLLYDDVSYIKQGYINRNTILSNSGPVRFTVPVPGASSNKKISSLEFSNDINKVLKTIGQSYSKSLYFNSVFPLIVDVLTNHDRKIASVCLSCYEKVFGYLGLSRKFINTSSLDYDRSKPAKDRLVILCQKFGANRYINSPGGRKLYSRIEFEKDGIDLKFIHSRPIDYDQGSGYFIPNLSIIDVLMHCSPGKILRFLCQYELD